MTRKDFQLVADVVAASTVTANLTDTQREDLAYEFARKLATTNPRFAAARFFVACGMSAEAANAMTTYIARGAVSLPREA